MQQLILVLHVIFSITLVALILIQHGKGADAGASFGAGSANTMFGSQGATPFLVKITGLAAGLFIVTSLILGYMAYQQQPQVQMINNELSSPNSDDVSFPSTSESSIPSGEEKTKPKW